MNQSDSLFSVEVVEAIRRRHTKDDMPSAKTRGTPLQGFPFEYTHNRPLPRKTASKAMMYIRAICAEYPIESRHGIAKPLWNRFQEAWCDTGDEGKSLRAI